MLVIAHYNYEAALFVVVCSPRVGAAPLNPLAAALKINRQWHRHPYTSKRSKVAARNTTREQKSSTMYTTNVAR